MNEKQIINIGDTVSLKSPSHSSHRYFTWDKGIITSFSSDKTECKITSVVKGVQKTFVEFVDNIIQVKI